jgi:hypothetical protein
MPKADSTAPESVEWATDSLAPKPPPSKSTFEDRVIQLQEHDDDYGHLRVPRSYTSDRCEGLGLWVKNIRQAYKAQKVNSSLLGVEIPGIVLASTKLSKLRIERLEAMGFKWSLQQRAKRKTDSTAPESVEQATDSLSTKRAPGKSTAAKECFLSFDNRVVELQEDYDEHGHLRVPRGYKGSRGKALGLWVGQIRGRYKNPSRVNDERPGIVLGACSLTKKRITLLEGMGFVSEMECSWAEYFQELVEFKVSISSAP